MLLAFEQRVLLPFLPLFLIAANDAKGESRYRMEGFVTNAETKEPVPGATVQVLVESDPDPSPQIRRDLTDEHGRYSIELPAGHGLAWLLLPPEGYCTVGGRPTEAFATTDDRPIFRKNYQVLKGTTFDFLVRYPATMGKPPNHFVSMDQERHNEYIQEYCEVDEQATGRVTLLDPDGEFSISCGDEAQTIASSEGVAVDVERGFNPQAVSADIEHQDDGRVVVHDINGFAAILTNCNAMVNDQRLVIVLDVKVVISDRQPAQLQGRVIDGTGVSIQGATVTAAYFSEGGDSTSTENSTTTDSDGRFRIMVPILNDKQKVGLIVTHDAYGGFVTKSVALAANSVTRVAPITLPSSCEVRVRVVGTDGKPVHGAVVEPMNDYASRTRIGRTGPNGECQLSGLAPGLSRVTVRFGSQQTSTGIPLNSGRNGLVKVSLGPSGGVAHEGTPALTVGTIAPEWRITSWTDGRQRKLSDYRGKVVVLDFWGIWCAPCVHAIPAMKKLHERYTDDEVVLIGIHTAGTDMALVKRLLRQQNWHIVIGTDFGKDAMSGVTIQRYRIRGFPTVIIVDRNGVITFNSSAFPEDGELFLRQMRNIATKSGLPWPIDKDGTDEEAIEQTNRLLHAMYAEKINEALQE